MNYPNIETTHNLKKYIDWLIKDKNRDCRYHLEVENQLQDEIAELLEALKSIVHSDDENCKCLGCKIGKPAIKKATL